jgi:hypothetical protein
MVTTSNSAVGLAWNANQEEKTKKTLFWKPKFMESSAIFVHIPRTGGTSVEVSVFGMPQPPNSCTQHFTAMELRDLLGHTDFDNAHKFSIVRSPFTRLASAYSHLMVGASSKPYNKDAETSRIVRSFPNFHAFVLHLKDVFSQGPAAIAELHSHFLPQQSFLCNGVGELMVESMIRFEDLGTKGLHGALAPVYERVPRLQPKSEATAAHMRPTQGGAAIWTDATRALVAQIYADDFKLLGYDPDRLPQSCLGCPEAHLDMSRECELCGMCPT